MKTLNSSLLTKQIIRSDLEGLRHKPDDHNLYRTMEMFKFCISLPFALIFRNDVSTAVLADAYSDIMSLPYLYNEPKILLPKIELISYNHDSHRLLILSKGIYICLNSMCVIQIQNKRTEQLNDEPFFQPVDGL